jgi:GntR family transcriptional regulator, rspAB operon transcriptional repressor
MPTRATKKTEATVRSATASHRRIGRPRTATASSKIYSDLRTELVSLQRRPGEVISEAEIALSYGGEPNACSRSHPEISR